MTFTSTFIGLFVSVYQLYTGDSKMRTLANIEDPDEMPHNAAFHQCLHCLRGQKYREK